MQHWCNLYAGNNNTLKIEDLILPDENIYHGRKIPRIHF